MHSTDYGEKISGELQGNVGLFIKYSAILTIVLNFLKICDVFSFNSYRLREIETSL